MKANDPAVKWVEEPQLGLAGKMYLPLFVQGLITTATRICSARRSRSAFPKSGRRSAIR